MLKSGTKYAYVNNFEFGGLIYRYTSIFLTDLTPQEQRSERNLPGAIVPWRDIFDKW